MHHAAQKLHIHAYIHTATAHIIFPNMIKIGNSTSKVESDHGSSITCKRQVSLPGLRAGKVETHSDLRANGSSGSFRGASLLAVSKTCIPNTKKKRFLLMVILFSL